MTRLRQHYAPFREGAAPQKGSNLLSRREESAPVSFDWLIENVYLVELVE